VIDYFLYNKQNPLLFTRPAFWIFLLIVYTVFTVIYKKTFWRNTWLFVVSIFFYYKSSGFFFILLLLSVIVNFFIGNKLYKTKITKHKKRWVVISVIYNLIWLIYFKYTYFFIELTNNLFGTKIEVHDWIISSINNISNTHFDASQILLPVGISFYTFQIISYIVDLYRNNVKPIRNILDFGFYVSFFPQLIAGPIVRASSFVPQMYSKYKVHKDEASQALFLILNGLIKKVIIADYISINFVDRVFDSPLSYSGLENLLAIYGYSIQIYCDFSGYTDIAIGLALWMGFRLPVNFNSPYSASNITDFWRRWHISLSSWLKDYLYIPLGGNKKGKVRTYINLFITMLLGGLWHGASLRFIIWGALHGAFLSIHKIWSKITPTKKSNLKILKIFLTFHLVTFAWIIFRAENVTIVKNMFLQIFTNFHGELTLEIIKAYHIVISLIFIAFIIHWLPKSFKNWYKGKFIDTPLVVKIAITLITIITLTLFTSSEIQPFIYFQF